MGIVYFSAAVIAVSVKPCIGIVLAHTVRVPGHVVQSVMCLATDASLTADLGVASLIPAGPILSWVLIMK